MLIAAAANANPGDLKNIGTDSAAASPVRTRSPLLKSTATALASPQSQLYPAQKSSLCKLQAELPIARRHSLQQFFEKRRDRLVSKTPYPIPSATRMADNTKTNLSAEASPEEVCFNKTPMSQEEIQPNAAVHIA